MLQQKFSWPVPYQTWEHIHIDHAGPIEGKSYSQLWMTKRNASKLHQSQVSIQRLLIRAVWNLFAHFGLLKSPLSDNGSGFCSIEFFNFLSQNSITHIRTALYHPNSNGFAEASVRAVQLYFKNERLLKSKLDFCLITGTLLWQHLNHVEQLICVDCPLRSRLHFIKIFDQFPKASETSDHTILFVVGELV